MDFKINREYLMTTETVFAGSCEQAVELDYILPDYLPDIFKILNCNLEPKIISSAISADKLVLEIICQVKICYISQGSNRINVIEQKLHYTKYIDLSSEPVNPEIDVSCVTDYVNVRAINAKRIDVKGAVCVTGKVTSQKKSEAVIDAFGEGIQLKKTDIFYPSKKITATKTVTLSEKIELGQNNMNIEKAVRSEVKIKQDDVKTLPDKMVVKGTAYCKTIYTCKDLDDDSLQNIEFEIAFSQIIDVDGLTENFDNKVKILTISVDIIPIDDGAAFDCDVTIKIDCVCVKYEQMKIVSDAFSTLHPCEYSTVNKIIDKPILNEKIPITVKETLEYKECDILCIYDAFAKPTKLLKRYEADKNIYLVNGKIDVCVIGKNENYAPFFIEKETSFEKEISFGKNIGTFDAEVEIINTTYALTSANTVEVKVELILNCNLSETSTEKIIEKIDLDETTLQKDDFALKLYFSNENEKVFDIAKKYSACADSIIKENDLSDDVIKEKTMLLIPIN